MIRVGINPLPWVLDETFHLDVPSLEAGFTAVSKAGFTAVQADIPVNLTVNQYQDLLQKFGLSPAPGYLAVSFENQLDEAELKRVEAFAKQQKQLGLSTAFLAGEMNSQRSERPTCGVDLGISQSHLVANVRQVSQIMSDQGITPMLHPHVGTSIEVAAEVRLVFDNVSSQILAFGPDTGHLYWAGVELIPMLRDYRNRIFGAHVKDVDKNAIVDGSNYSTSTRINRVWTEPTRGSLPMGEVIDTLSHCPNLSWVVIEVDVPNLGSAQESTEFCAKWVQEQPILKEESYE